ncbi:MAG: aminopeptidase P N-terminal domain-containing protein [Acidimicrobiia bacterium]|nr:aminopeptidase P N-terminal domain-containing protein [Acidimicrobiia bacterium]MDH4306559.1 aminopeptidase P N-terminal domain-containing protein [Acidimicrobiia bacterium]
MTDRFHEHRTGLASHIGTNGIAVVPASVEKVRNDDVTHLFRQDSDFAYLTGFHEPDAVAVIVPGHPEGDFHLFVRPKDREREIWDGLRTGTEGAMSRFGADAAYDLAELDTALVRLMVGRDTLFYKLGNPAHDDRMTRLLATARSHRERFGSVAPTAVHDVGTVLAELRVVKNPAELDSLRAACELSAEGHREAMRFTRPGLYEYQVQAAMEFVWREGGSRDNGYGSIVAAGRNAVILHYTENDCLIEDGDLVLIDAGCEIDWYTADITRTFPASGIFVGPQRDVYEAVLAAHHAAIRGVVPGGTFRDTHDTARRVLTEHMVDLGLIPTDADSAFEMHLYREFFMHGTSHWLGLDVHDAGVTRTPTGSRILEPGMCFTVEPGLYVNPDRPTVEFTLLEHDLDAWTERRLMLGAAAAAAAEQVEKDAADKLTHEIPAELLGLGVRIEDDILVTVDGHENLTGHVPVEPAKIEHLCAESSWLHRE